MKEVRISLDQATMARRGLRVPRLQPIGPGIRNPSWRQRAGRL
jgi:hypothetical protein